METFRKFIIDSLLKQKRSVETPAPAYTAKEKKPQLEMSEESKQAVVAKIKDFIEQVKALHQAGSLPEGVAFKESPDGSIQVSQNFMVTGDDPYASRDVVTVRISRDPATESIGSSVTRYIKLNAVERFGEHRKVDRVQHVGVEVKKIPVEATGFAFRKKAPETQTVLTLKVSDTETEYIPQYYSVPVKAEFTSAEQVLKLLEEMLSNFEKYMPLYESGSQT